MVDVGRPVAGVSQTRHEMALRAALTGAVERDAERARMMAVQNAHAQSDATQGAGHGEYGIEHLLRRLSIRRTVCACTSTYFS